MRGFTLVEMVIALGLTAVVASFAAYFIAVPVRGYDDLSRRAQLVDRADLALRGLGRDLRRALPNSVRITTSGASVALEMMATVDGARYRDRPPPGNPARILDFAAPDDSFNSVGPFNGIVKPFSSTSHFLSIYNAGVPGADAWELANVITPPGTRIDIDSDTLAGEDRVTLVPPFRFRYGSPSQRMFLVSGPITYLCDPVAAALTRYSGYTVAAAQTDRDSDAELMAAGARRALITDRISACAFSYTPGTAQRAALVSARLEVAQAGERVALMHQVHVVNAP